MAILDNLKQICEREDVVEHVNVIGDNKFSAVIRSKIYNDNDREQGMNYSDWCDSWIKKFSVKFYTNWIVRYTYPSAQKYLYRKVFKCQHHSFDKIRSRKLTSSRNRDKDCTASINILFKKINRGTIKNDVHLKSGLNIKVEASTIYVYSIFFLFFVQFCDVSLNRA